MKVEMKRAYVEINLPMFQDQGQWRVVGCRSQSVYRVDAMHRYLCR